MMPSGIEVRAARPCDYDGLREGFARLIADGEGFPQIPPLSDTDFDVVWRRGVTEVVVADAGGAVVGAYVLKPNQPGRGAHVANAGYFVVPERRGSGIGRMLVEDSIERARALGFRAIEFNLVFESNPARRLYEALGFRCVGTVPDAVRTGDGFEDAHIYWRSVVEDE